MAVFLLLPSLHWLWRDVAVWPWDPAYYGMESVDLWHALTHDFSAWPAQMINAFGAKAPGIAWFGQFFVLIGGALGKTVEFGLLLSVLLVQAASLILTYRFLSILSGRTAIAWVGVVFMAAAPLFIAMSHQFFVEPMQLFSVTLFYWLAASSNRMRRFDIALYLVLAFSFAMLAKITSPLYCALPGCITLYDFLKARKKSPPLPVGGRLALGLTAGLLLCGVIGWYAHNYGAIREFAAQASSGDVALNYGHRGRLSSKLGFWLDCLQQNNGLVWVLIVIGLLIMAGSGLSIAAARRKRSIIFDRFDWVALAALLHNVAILILFSLSINEDNRYLLPLLPSLTVMVAWGVARMPVKYECASWLAVAVLLVQWGLVHAQAHGYIKPLPHIAYWIIPVQRDDARMRTDEKIIAATCAPDTAERMNIVGVELPWLNANTIGFYNSKAMLQSGPHCNYTWLGYAETDTTKAWQRLKSLNIAYYIALAPDPAEKPDAFNLVSLPILQKIQKDRLFKPVAFASSSGVMLFRNLGPVNAK